MILTLNKNHGYVMLTLIGTECTLFYLGIQVSKARTLAGVPYPLMYATAQEADQDRKKHIFNCVQRGHQNTLEHIPGFLILLGLSAIEYPVVSAVSGAVYLASRIVYAKCYATGDPKKRARGAFGYFALLAMLGCAGATTFKLLTE
ncbi:Microsomal glutathione S-transferase 3 [Boothiomyces sp. JEL0838]|nr:Microsomal glutathione S-transferase 3 [Boothiomyces sp. JEL0838]